MGNMSLKDIRLQTAKIRSEKHIPSKVWGAMVWDNWQGYSKWDAQQIIEQGYQRNPPFYSACNIIAQTIADMPIFVEYEKQGVSDTTSYHPILKVLSRNESLHDFIEKVVLYYVVTGASYNQIVFSPTDKTKPLGVIPLPTQWVSVVQGDEYSPIKGYKLTHRKEVSLGVNEVIPIIKPDLTNPFTGMSPAVALAELLDLYNASVTWNKNVALAGGLPPVIAKAPVGTTPEEMKAVQDAFQDQSGARNAHRLKIVANALEFEDIGTTPHDAEWTQAILSAMRMILMGLGVSSSLMNDAANKTYNNVKDSRKALYLDACLPVADKIYNTISRHLKPFFKDNPEIKVNRKLIEALQEDEEKKAKRLKELVDSGIMSRNEARVQLNLKISHDEIADKLIISNTPTPVETPTQTPIEEI